MSRAIRELVSRVDRPAPSTLFWTAMGKSDEEIWKELDASADFHAEVDRVAGYRMPKHLVEVFARPMLVCEGASIDRSIAPARESEKWAKVARHIDEVGQSLSAMHYHLGNVRRMEAQLDQVVQKYAPRTPLARGGAWNPNVTNRLTFEYHAFAFVAVRCLTHVSLTIGCVFDKTCRTLRSLPKNVLDGKSKAGHEGAAELLRILLAHRTNLAHMFTRGSRKSIRDQIAHYRFLPAGSLRIGGRETKLLGVLETGADDTTVGSRTEYRLSEIMGRQLNRLETFILATLEALENHCLPRI